MRLDLIDEFRLDLHPYVAAERARLFDDVAGSSRLDLVSSSEFRNGSETGSASIRAVRFALCVAGGADPAAPVASA